MFQAKRMLFIYVETPLHVGGGRSLGAVDLPIQRERTTGYPMVQASSLKGKLRALADPQGQDDGRLSREEFLAIFGPEAGPGASEYAGALSVGDARLLLFPVRSLAGVFAWTTSRNALARFQREAETMGLTLDWKLPPEPGKNQAWVGEGTVLKAGDSVVLEEFSFAPQTEQLANTIAQWLAQQALPEAKEYEYWRDSLPRRLCILPEDAFRDFTLYATEVETHVKLDPSTKTVASGGALWTSESLPADSLLYAPLLATPSRIGKKGAGDRWEPTVRLDGEGILKKIEELSLTRAQLGGDETTGQGMVALRLVRGGAQ